MRLLTTLQDMYLVPLHIDLLATRARVRRLEAGLHLRSVAIRSRLGHGADDIESTFGGTLHFQPQHFHMMR